MVEKGSIGRCPRFALVDEKGEPAEEYDPYDFELLRLCEGDRWVGVHGEMYNYVWRGRTPESVVMAYLEERLEANREALEEERKSCEERLKLAERAEDERERESWLRSHAACLETLEELERDARRLEKLLEGLRTGRIKVEFLEGER